VRELRFGNCVVGEQSHKDFTLWNCSEVPLVFRPVALFKTPRPAFKVSTCCEQSLPHIYPDISGDGFQYHSSQLTFSDEWYRPQSRTQTPGSVTFPPPGFDSTLRGEYAERRPQYAYASPV